MRALRSPALFVIPLLAAAAAGCGDDGGSGGAGAGGSGGAGGGGPQAVPCDGAPAELALAGTWVASGRLAVTLEGVPGGAISICPADQIGESRLLMLITMEQAGPTELAEVRATLCSVALPEVTALVGSCDPGAENLVTTTIVAPQTLIDALPSVATQTVGGTLGGTDAGAPLTLDRFVVTAGSTAPGPSMPSWDVDAPACTSADLGRTSQCEATCVSDCAALRDDDADGYPGVTVHVCGATPQDVQNGRTCQAEEPNTPGTALQGRAFIDLQVDPQFTGAAESSCEIRGTVDTDVLYNLVGGDIWLAGGEISVTSAIKSLPFFQVDPAESRFRMVRIDGQYGAPDWGVDPSSPSAACQVLVAREAEL